MDSDETLTSQSQFSSSVQLMEDVSLEDIMNCGVGYDQNLSQNHLYPHKYMSSRLSSCSSFSNGQGQVMDQGNGNPECYDHGGYTSMCRLHSMSLLSIESFDGGADADEELSDDNKEKGQFFQGFSSESDDGGIVCYSLPATPPRKRLIVPTSHHKLLTAKKDYKSETDAQETIPDPARKINRYYKRSKGRSKCSRKSSTTMEDLDHTPAAADKGKVLDSEYENINNVGQMTMSVNNSSFCLSGGESEGSGLMVITKPKGGTRSICMDMDEVKACRELGFELEHERMLEMPSRLSVSVSNLDTSSGGNSPIASWRISSPGDNPREVKARLKVWAQAVAIVSSTTKPTN